MILSCPSCSKRFILDEAMLGDGRRVKCGNCAHIWYQEPPPAGDRPSLYDPPAGDDDPFGAIPSTGSPDTRPWWQEKTGAEEDVLASLTDDGAGALSPPSAGSAKGRDRTERKAETKPRKPTLPARPEDLARQRRFRRQAAMAAVLVLFWGGVSTGLVFGRDMILETWPPANRLYQLFGAHVEPFQTGLDLQADQPTVLVVEGINLLQLSGRIHNVSDRLRPVPDVMAQAVGRDGQPLQSWRIRPGTRQLQPGERADFSSRVPETAGEAERVDFVLVPPEGATALIPHPPPGTAVAAIPAQADTGGDAPPADAHGAADHAPPADAHTGPAQEPPEKADAHGH